MSIKTEVGAIIAGHAAQVEKESEFYAGIGEYGLSDRLDRIVEGLKLARQAYLEYVPTAEPEYVIPDSLHEFLKTAPVGSTINYLVDSNAAPYATAVGDGKWKSRSDTYTWTYTAFSDNEQFIKAVPNA